MNISVAAKLAAEALKLLTERGQIASPTHREVTYAVVESADKLGMMDDPDAPRVYIAAIDMLASQRHWRFTETEKRHRPATGTVTGR